MENNNSPDRPQQQAIEASNPEILKDGETSLKTIRTKLGVASMTSDACEMEENQDRVAYNTGIEMFAVIDGIGGYEGGALAAQILTEEILLSTKAGISAVQMQNEAHKRMSRMGISRGGACYLYFIVEGKKVKINFSGDVQLMIVDMNGNIKFISETSNIRDTPRGEGPGFVQSQTENIMNNDFLIAASDGLWDNIDHNHIGQIIKDNPRVTTESLSKELFASAKSSMLKGHYRNLSHVGGKRDNLSIVVYQKLPQ